MKTYREILNEENIISKQDTHALKLMLTAFNKQATRARLKPNELKMLNDIVKELTKRGEEV
jgi:tRNA C32,U32 (ribose-2'-O)-methylase TrmJ